MNASYKQVTKARYIAQVAALAEEIFVEHYHKLTPKVAAALAVRYQSDDLTDDEIHRGVNYFLVYLGTEAVGYFALDLSPAGALQITRLFLRAEVRGRGIGRDIVRYAQKLAEGDGRTRLFLQLWAKDMRAVSFCKQQGFRLADSYPAEVLPGTTLELATYEKLWR